MEIRVYYEDTDVNGIVYHPNYIKYCDRARSEYFFKSGVPLKVDNSYLVIRNLDAKYFKPAFLGDILVVTTKVESFYNASVTLYNEILRKKSYEKIFSLHITLVYVTNGLPSKLPNSFIEIFQQNGEN